MTAYYNENDPKAAAWLRELIKVNAIAPGEVDDRSIVDVTPAELAGFTQCHFFAGIGVWSYALRLAGWPDDRPVWTGSCPCQPFSAAGKGDGFADERHLWPMWFHLIAFRQPPVLFGEQVASKNADAWIDLVCADLEAMDYTFGAVPFPAAGVGAPHIRDRTYWVANAPSRRRGIEWSEAQPGRVRHADRGGDSLGGMAHTDDTERRPERAGGHHSGGADAGRSQGSSDAEGCGELRRVANTDGRDAGAEGLQRSREHGQQPQDGGADGVAQGDAISQGLEGFSGHGDYPRGRAFPLGSIAASGAVGGFWRDAEVVYCRDGKLRPVEPGSFPLAHGIAGRVGRLRGYGNAIVAEAAAEFIRASQGVDA